MKKREFLVAAAGSVGTLVGLGSVPVSARKVVRPDNCWFAKKTQQQLRADIKLGRAKARSRREAYCPRCRQWIAVSA
jgi:hypothetical protein